MWAWGNKGVLHQQNHLCTYIPKKHIKQIVTRCDVCELVKSNNQSVMRLCYTEITKNCLDKLYVDV